MKYVLLYSSIIANILTNVGFNLSALNDATPTKKWGFFSGGLVFGLINSLLFTESLKYIPLQIASAIFFSLTIVGLSLAAHFVFGEEVTIRQIAGTVVIVIGVLLVSFK